MVQHFRPELSLAEADHIAQKIWDVLLLGYCLVAGVVPVWLLLQPRGHLGGYFLYVALAVGAIGVLFGNFPIQYDAFNGWDAVGNERRNVLSVPVHHDRLRRLLRLPLADRLGHDVEATPLRDRRQADRLRRDAAGSDGRHRSLWLRDDAQPGRRARCKQGPNQIYAGGLSEFLERAAASPRALPSPSA